MKILTTYNKKGYIYERILLENGDTELVMQHRRLWEERNGKIPEGHEIHHKDHDRANNELDNLMCLPAREHTTLFHNIAKIRLNRED